jgi:heat shock protein HslJ
MTSYSFSSGLIRLMVVALAAAPLAASAQSEFPFGRELLLDVAPMKGSKRVPSLDIGGNGGATIALWCDSVPAQLIVVADTITVIPGEKTARQCPADLARADDDLIATLAQVASWTLDGELLVLSGGPAPLRFRMQTN